MPSLNSIIVEQDGTVQEASIESGSYAYSLQVKQYGGRSYFSLSKFKKWQQDGKYHPDKAVVVRLEDFRDKILPAIAQMFGKQLV